MIKRVFYHLCASAKPNQYILLNNFEKKLRMYIPGHYKETDNKKILDIIQKYPFATVVTSVENQSHITHLPIVANLNDKTGKLTLFSHLAKANPHWKTWIETAQTTVVFNGPHAYISPVNYLSRQNVPTWNYIAVHATGKAIILQKDEYFECLRKTISFFEPGYIAQMDELPEKYMTGMLNEIVAFKIDVENIESKFKLSQNKKPVERQNIIDKFSAAENTVLQELAAYMKAEENA